MYNFHAIIMKFSFPPSLEQNEAKIGHGKKSLPCYSTAEGKNKVSNEIIAATVMNTI